MSINIRPARDEDRTAMLQITKGVWGGTDYVPFVWNEWLNDPSGYLQVATLDGRVVGLQHTVRQSDDSAWADGIRVADEARGRGVGQAMLHNAIDWARNMGCCAIRLSTESSNGASNRVFEKGGFRVVAQFDALAATPSAASTDGHLVRIGMPHEVDDILRLLRCGVDGATPRTFYTEGWTAYALSSVRLTQLLAAHAVLVVGPNPIRSVAIATATVRRSALRLGLVRGAERDMAALGEFIRTRAAATGMVSVRSMAQVDETAGLALAAAGFESRGVRMFLHEKELGPL